MRYFFFLNTLLLCLNITFSQSENNFSHSFIPNFNYNSELNYSQYKKIQIRFKETILFYKRSVCNSESREVIKIFNNFSKNYSPILSKDEFAILNSILEKPIQNFDGELNDLAIACDNFGNYVMLTYGDKSTSYKYFIKALKIRNLNTNEDTIFSLFRLVDFYLYFNNYKKAKIYLDKTQNLINTFYQNDNDKNSLLLDFKGRYYTLIWKLNKAEECFKKSYDILLNTYNAASFKLCSSYKHLSKFYLIKGDYDKALKYTTKSYNIESQFYDLSHPSIIKLNLNKALIYKAKGMYTLASKILNNNLSEHLKQFDLYHPNMYIICYNLISIYHKTGQRDLALQYCFKVLEIARKLNKTDISFSSIYNRMGLVYLDLENYSSAEYYFEKSLQLKKKSFSNNHPALADSYNNLGSIQVKRNNINQALYYFKKSLKIKKDHFGESHKSIANSYKEIGKLYIIKKDYRQAEYYFNYALSIRKKLYGMDNFNTKIIQNLLAECYLKSKKYKKTLYYSNLTLSNLKNIKYNFDEADMEIVLNALHYKFQVYDSYYKRSGEIKYLDSCSQIAVFSDKIIHLKRKNLLRFNDKINFSSSTKKLYKSLIANQKYLEKLQSNIKNIRFERAFFYSEDGKSNTLREQLITEYTKMHNKNLDLLRLEQKVNTIQSTYRDLISVSYSKKRKDLAEQVSLEKKLKRLSKNLDSLTILIEKNYPRYHQLKYKDKVITVKEVQQKLAENQTLLEFFVADSTTYAFTISKNHYQIKELLTPELKKKITAFRKMLTSKDHQNYKNQAFDLYNMLIKPVKNNFVGDELIIVPDESLWHLSFDLLLTKKSYIPETINLPYLLKDYAISYANSATLLFNSFQLEDSKNKQKGCLAFSFSDSTKTVTSDHMSLATLRATGDDLPGTRKEIKAISKIVDGQYFFGTNADEATFKKNASNYKILHLALHGEVDNENPENSKLYFTKSKDTIEDNYLYSHELFALNIPAELTVLSACNTGTGKIAKGEGIMSLGNAFQYAGTKSLLLSSWEVPDETTPQLMQNFYTNLKDGMNKAKALQQAKLQYLQQADIYKTDPFYWGGFYLVGDPAPIDLGSTSRWYWILGITGLFLLLIIFLCLKDQNQVKKFYSFFNEL